jgi:excisionase family DNA binding protein
MPKSKPTLAPIAVSAAVAAGAMGVSLGYTHKLIKAKQLPSFKDGRRRLILVADINARLDHLRRKGVTS